MSKRVSGRFGKRGELAWLCCVLAAVPAGALHAAELELPPVSVGAGLRSSFSSSDVDGAAEDVNDFTLESIRLYLSGSVTETIGFTFNTEFKGDADNSVQVLDALARFEFSPGVNIWAGRLLPPSDRANLDGPFYANNFRPFVDGIQDGFPMIAGGRDNGVVYWGDFGRFKFSLGGFDVSSTKGDENIVAAARAQFNFWDLEPGYYLSSTYYGEKDILAIGAAVQSSDGDEAVTVDLLLEKNLAELGVATFEAEYASYDGLGGFGSPGGTPFSESDGYFVLGAWLFPQPVGPGKVQLLAKHGTATFDTALGDLDLDTTEFNINYIVKGFDARFSLFYLIQNAESPGADSTQIGLGMQLQI